MNVVKAGRETNDHSSIDRDGKMVIRIEKERLGGSRIDGVIKHTRSDLAKHRLITGAENPDLNRHASTFYST